METIPADVERTSSAVVDAAFKVHKTFLIGPKDYATGTHWAHVVLRRLRYNKSRKYTGGWT